ncbi:MAG: transposase, partial [Rhodothermales bacterium]
SYAVGVKETTSVRWPSAAPEHEAAAALGDGASPYEPEIVSKDEVPVSARELAMSLPKKAYEALRWREGTKGTMRSRFAAVRVCATSREPEWLLVEWPASKAEPTDFWLSSVPEHVEISELVALAKIRWRIERDYQELKDELGLDHYEGRGWRGFHHHGVLCMATYCYLAAERGRLSPPQTVAFLRPATLPKGFAPRGSPRASRKT